MKSLKTYILHPAASYDDLTTDETASSALKKQSGTTLT